MKKIAKYEYWQRGCNHEKFALLFEENGEIKIQYDVKTDTVKDLPVAYYKNDVVTATKSLINATEIHIGTKVFYVGAEEIPGAAIAACKEVMK